jgi:hypothetical protein
MPATKAAETMSAAPVISADAVRVSMEDAVIVHRAPPSIRAGAPYRMPKVFRLPGGELCCPFSIGADTYADQGQTSPFMVSGDEGATWEQRWPWPHPSLRGMNPVIMPVHDGEFWCLPSGQGLRLDTARFPRRVGTLGVYVGFSLYRLSECPEDMRRWFMDTKALRWSPATKEWSEEQVRWDHRGQLLWCNEDTPNRQPGVWGQRVYFEGPVVRVGSELVYADYWTVYEDGGRLPEAWECSLMASSDNGRSWTRRSSMATLPLGDNTGEPVIELNDRGELVGVTRRECGKWDDWKTRNPSMYLMHSADQGRSWSERRTLFDFGVFPRLLQLANGVLVLTYGRPGVRMSFSLDGGRSWTAPRALIDDWETCGYTSLLALDRDRFIIAYSDADLPDERGRPCKTILTRRIEVAPA